MFAFEFLNIEFRIFNRCMLHAKPWAMRALNLLRYQTSARNRISKRKKLAHKRNFIARKCSRYYNLPHRNAEIIHVFGLL